MSTVLMNNKEHEIGDIVDGYEIVDETYFIAASGKIKKTVLDEYYIEAYLENPKSKRKALQAVYDEVGIDRKATIQSAHAMHNRLLGEIESRLLKLSLDDKALGRSVLRKLCQDAESESVKAQTATTLAKGLYPDVQITKDMSLEDINREIEKLEEDQKGHVEGWAH